MGQDISCAPARWRRRDLLTTGAGAALGGLFSAFSGSAMAQGYDASRIKALAFDVYGTCTDYWSAIVRAGQAINREKGLDTDWGAVPDDWKGLYPPSFAAVLKGQRPW